MPHKEPSDRSHVASGLPQCHRAKEDMDHQQLTLSPEQAAQVDEVLQVLEQLEHQAGPGTRLARRAG